MAFSIEKYSKITRVYVGSQLSIRIVGSMMMLSFQKRKMLSDGETINKLSVILTTMSIRAPPKNSPIGKYHIA